MLYCYCRALQRYPEEPLVQHTTGLVFLVFAVLRIYFPQGGHKLVMYPFAHIAGQDEAALGERAVTRFTFSNYKYGGFCIAPPGSCSNAQLFRETDKPKDETKMRSGLLTLGFSG